LRPVAEYTKETAIMLTLSLILLRWAKRQGWW
jgi:hypothetical protein